MRNSNNPPTTPLLAILRQLDTDARRDEFASLAGTTTGYLYQLAGCNRSSCRNKLAMGIEQASRVMNARYGTDVITMQELASMCPLPQKLR